MTGNLIDFSSAKQLVNDYNGAATKIKVEFNGQIYLLKFGQVLEPDPKKPLQASYENSPLSEHISSSIYRICRIPAQETALGIYDNRKVVACLDFIENTPRSQDFRLIEFKNLENSFLGSTSSPRKTPELSDLLAIFEEHPALEGLRQSAIDRYWDMFIVDSLVGNFDRHTGNWGYILDRQSNRLCDLAPVYDCASSLYPRLNEETMLSMIEDPEALSSRVKNFPKAALKVNGKKVHYHDFLLSPEGKQARSALVRLMPMIDSRKIHDLINDLPDATSIQKRFLSALVEARFEIILVPAHELGLKENKQVRIAARARSVEELAARGREKADAHNKSLRTDQTPNFGKSYRTYSKKI